MNSGKLVRDSGYYRCRIFRNKQHVDTPAPTVPSVPASDVTAITAFLPGGGSAYDNSSYIAVYGPWITVPDPPKAAGH